jgi:hypothetical protein
VTDLVVTEAVFMHYLKNYALGSHLVDWFALAVIVVLTVAVRIGRRRFILWLTYKCNSDKSEKEYWRMHGE